MQECRDIADCGKPQTGDQRILRGIREFVERTLLEGCPGRNQLDRCEARTCIVPAGGRNGNRRIFNARSYCQSCSGFVGSRRGIRQRPCECRAVVDDELLERESCDRRAVGILGNGYVDGKTAPAGWRRDIPAAPYDRVPLPHEKSVSGIRGRCRIITPGSGIVHLTKGKIAAAIVKLEEEPVVSLGKIDRSEDVNICRVLHIARRILGREADVRNREVLWIVRIYFSKCTS